MMNVKVKDVMTPTVRFIEPTTTLQKAAALMREMGCGFLPVSNADNTRLDGVVTDRDIIIRAVAEGMNPASTTVGAVKSNKVLYCCADDDLEEAIHSMEMQRVYRLIVLDGRQSKQLCGVVSLGDVYRFDETGIASKAAKAILERAA